MTFRVRSTVGAVLFGLAALTAVAFAPLAAAEPTLPPPGPTSTDEELVDMVLEAIEDRPGHGPSTTPVAPPPTP